MVAHESGLIVLWPFVLNVLFIISPALSQAADSKSEFQPTTTAEERARVEDVKRKAEQGSVQAQNEISKVYMNGYVFKRNARAAAMWARAAANQGSVEAQVNLGTFYYAGQGVARDYAQARYWLLKGADQGNAQAEQNLGVMYIRGEGVKTNFEAALQWFLKSAEQGDAPGAYNVGVMYSKGVGVPRDEIKGYKWHLIAARFGYLPSRNALKALGSKMDPARIAKARSSADEWVRGHPNVQPILR
jgi:TPR repeat protein